MTAAAGTLSLAQEHLRTLLANCTAVRTWLGVATEAAALARIYHHGLPTPAAGVFTREELEALRPYAVVFTAERQGLRFDMDAFGSFAASGSLRLRLYQDCPESLDDEPTSDANMQWGNTVGQIMAGMVGLVNTPGYLSFHALRIEEGPYWSHPKMAATEGVWQGVELGVDWRGLP